MFSQENNEDRIRRERLEEENNENNENEADVEQVKGITRTQQVKMLQGQRNELREKIFGGDLEDAETAQKRWLAMRWQQKQDELQGKSILYRLMVSTPDEFILVKLIWGVPLGLFVGFLIYYLVLGHLQVSTATKVQFSVIFITTFGAAFAWSVSVRCMVALLFPMIFSNCGRFYMYALLTIILIKGPLGSFVANSHEVFRSILCAIHLLANQTRMLCTIRFVPLLEILITLVENQNDFIRMVDGVRQKLDAYLDSMKLPEIGIDDDVATRKVMSKAERDDLISKGGSLNDEENKHQRDAAVQQKTAEFFSRLREGCKDMMDQACRLCHSMYDAVRTTCMWMMTLIFFVCYIIDLFRRCDTNGLVKQYLNMDCQSIEETIDEDGLSEAITQLRATLDAFFDNFDAQYQFEDPNDYEAPEPTLPSIDQIRASIDQAFAFKKLLLDYSVLLLHRAIPFIFVYVLFSAHKYLDSFLTDIKHDNNYINSYFVHIDNRRKLLLKKALLPLKKLEQGEVVEVMSHKVTLRNSLKVLQSITWISTLGLYILVLYAIDHCLANVLLLFFMYAAVDFEHKGKAEFSLKVTGNGCLAHIIKILTKGFNIKRNLHIKTTNRACLPVPTFTDSSTFFEIYAFLFCIVSFYIVEPYLERYRHLVASFFFPKRQKARTLYLYNDIKRRRAGYVHQARHTVRRDIKNYKFTIPIGFFLSLRYAFPGYFEWLLKMGLGLQECTICKEPEHHLFKHCPTFLCKATYCPACWIDIGFRCYACKDDDDWSDSSSGDSIQDNLNDIYD